MTLTPVQRYSHSPKHDPEDEPTVTPLSPDYFEFDMHKDDLSKDQLKGRMVSLRCLAGVDISPLQNSCITRSSHSLPRFNDLIHDSQSKSALDAYAYADILVPIFFILRVSKP